MVGTTVSHYQILSPIGSGGMGVVYLAEDVRLHRKVALKFLNEAAGPGAHAEERLLREAQAEGGLDHPNIGTVYEIGEWQGRLFIAMAYYPGETLAERLERGPMAIHEVVDIASQIAAGLAAAHAAGVVHRDLKPANVLLTSAGQVKILDFGLAKVLPNADSHTATQMTGPGTTLGTISYMAPEQALGKDVDQRADVWAFGVVVFEMLAGRRPFEGTTPAALLLAVASADPVPIATYRPDVPIELRQIIAATLIKRHEDRTITVADISRKLEGHRDRRMTGAKGRTSAVGRRMALGLVAAGLVAAAVGGGWLVKRSADRRWLRSTAIPEIRTLIAKNSFFDAFERAGEARRRAPNDAELAAMWREEITYPVSVVTDPPGASVSIAAYGVDPERWMPLGETPLSGVAIPRGFRRLRITKSGFTMLEDIGGGPFPPPPLAVTLVPEASAPTGMVRVNGPDSPVPMYLVSGNDPVDIGFPDFWIDRSEVTNKSYKAFIDAGGYRKREYWKHDFIKGDTVVGWDDAVGSFRDATGRPGPATWQGGAYPEGQDDYPVTGVSWYEAAAYAEFAGKTLPTLPHWYYVAGYAAAARILPLANFESKAPVRVATTRAMHRFGAFDLAGNVKEWVLNPAGGNLRYILGGAWDEPAYMFTEPDARPPFERSANFGIRLARFDEGDRSREGLAAAIERPSRNYETERPVGDPVFAAYRRFFSYDRTPVKATVKSAVDSHADWRIETLAFPAAYGGETVLAHLFLPKRSSPPFQTVIFLTGSGQFNLRSSQPLLENPFFAHVLRSGRAVVAPIVKGAYERGSDEFSSTTTKSGTLWRDYVVAIYKDLARTIDYLETRPDLAHDKIGFLGLSRGASLSPVLLAQEPQRIKVAALLIPGFYLSPQAPEVDVINFMPRVAQPVLMLSGRYDFIFPERRAQIPFFQLLGSPADRKRRVVYDTGHNLPPSEMIKETLDWFDRHLGPAR